jgi:hypothetical protein
MSWENLLRRVLPPIGTLQPHTTSHYGAIRSKGTSPHRGVDANYNVGPNGQTGVNLQHPALRAPVDGIVTNAGEGAAGRIAIRDANGLSHEILHTHSRHVRKGDPVVAPIGTRRHGSTPSIVQRGPTSPTQFFIKRDTHHA